MVGKIEAELRIASSIPAKRTRFIDIGAHYGHWSYRLHKYFRSVEAFEPQPECARVIRAAHLSNVRVHECAISDGEGTSTLVVPIEQGKRQRGLATLEKKAVIGTGMPVSLRTLDSFDFQDASLIKIDVEGHEHATLAGAVRTLECSRPALVIEIEIRHRRRHPSETIEFLSSMGYRGYYLHKGRELKPLSEFSWERDQDPRKIATGDYVNNFIFVPLECSNVTGQVNR